MLWLTLPEIKTARLSAKLEEADKLNSVLTFKPNSSSFNEQRISIVSIIIHPFAFLKSNENIRYFFFSF